MAIPIPCVGFELLYSPVDQKHMDTIAYAVHSKSNRFIFSVVEDLSAGQEILILFSNNNGPTEQLRAEVKTCIQLDEGHYQVILETQPSSMIVSDSAKLIAIPIIRGPSTAQTISICCPSCKVKTNFRFIANQDGDYDGGILPIYNCESCGTTRAMTSLVRDKIMVSP